MALYMIGIGLNDEKDITVKGLEAVKKCSQVYLEDYTSLLQVPVENLERLYGKRIILADRNMVESGAELILDSAEEDDAAFLVVGDVFGATTHADLFLRAKERGIKTEVIFNASVLNAVSITGFELYKFGKTTSMPFWTENFRPENAYDIIKENLARGAHTVVLLDIKKDQGVFMTSSEAISILLEIEAKRRENVFTGDRKIVACARLGGDNVVQYARASILKDTDLGEPPHCIIVPSNLHFIEEEMLARFG